MGTTMNRLFDLWDAIVERLEGIGQWIAPLGLRLVLAWEFFEAGREKFSGSNWFMDIQGKFPFPFNIVPADISWTMATWTELLAAIGLFLGLGTRFWAFSLSVLTIVATAAVHWPDNWMMFSDLLQGYAITDKGHGNYKLPLLYLLMLLPLFMRGPGRLSLDALFLHLAKRENPPPYSDALGWGVLMVAMGLPLAMLVPLWGFIVAGVGAMLAVSSRFLRH
jgi:putative oxidoreductase